MANECVLAVKREDFLKFYTDDPSVINYIPSEQKYFLPFDNKVFHRLLNKGLYSVKRPECETNEEYIQILPYIVVSHYDKVFVYERGKKGTESRLYAKSSIGVGGHVSLSTYEDSESAPEVQNLGKEFKQSGKVYKLLVEQIYKELDEELGLKLRFSERFKLKQYLDYHAGGFYCLNDTVDRFHLALLIHIPIVDTKRLTALEKGVIQNGRFVDIKEVLDRNTTLSKSLESWSTVLVNPV